MLTLPCLALALAAAGRIGVNALAVPVKREAHFAQIMFPASDYVLLANTTETNASVPLQYRNGERADNTSFSVSLQNDTDTYLIVSDAAFYNWYYVNATLAIDFSLFADGNYTLIAQEILSSDVYSEVTQSFAISHDPTATSQNATAELVDVNPSADSVSYLTTGSVTVLVQPTATASGDAGATSATGDTVGDHLHTYSVEETPETMLIRDPW